MARNSTDFPVPDGPITPITSPLADVEIEIFMHDMRAISGFQTAHFDGELAHSPISMIEDGEERIDHDDRKQRLDNRFRRVMAERLHTAADL